MEDNNNYTDKFLEYSDSITSLTYSENNLTCSSSDFTSMSMTNDKSEEFDSESKSIDLKDLITKYSTYNKCDELKFNDKEYNEYFDEIDRNNIINKIVNSRGIIYEKDLKKLDDKDKEIVRLKRLLKEMEKERINLIIKFNEKIDLVKLDNMREMAKLKKKILQKDISN